MASFGSKKLINKIPHPGELRNPIEIARVDGDPDTSTATSTGFNYKYTAYRQCFAKIEIDEIKTSGTDEDFLQELTHNFIIRKAPNVKIIPKKDIVVYKDEIFVIQNVLEVNQDRQRFWQVIQTTRLRPLSNVDFSEVEVDTEVAKEDTENDSFFGGEW